MKRAPSRVSLSSKRKKARSEVHTIVHVNHWHSVPAEVRALVRAFLVQGVDRWALAAVSRFDWGEREHMHPINMCDWVHAQNLLSPAYPAPMVGTLVQDMGSRHLQLKLELLVATGDPLPVPMPMSHATRFGYIIHVYDTMYVDVCWTHATVACREPAPTCMPTLELSTPHGPPNLVNDMLHHPARLALMAAKLSHHVPRQ